jgi:hexosaminidase
MDATREETYTFLDGFLGEMAALFPDRYFHIGGDEVEDKGARELQAGFNRRVQALLKKHGKTMVGWDEVLQPGLDDGTVIQSWRGPAALAEAARKGYRGILSYGYYLDHLKPAAFHYAVQPPDDSLGGEACMWAEYVSAETVDSRIWPRMAAIAERFWSAREVTDVNSMYARMEAVSRVLDWTGAQHRAGYQRMLDGLGGNAEALRVLADASEATGIEVRRDARKYTSLVAMNRFVDAVRPESESVRRLELAARSLDRAARAELRAAFHQWAEVEARVEPGELKALAANLAQAGRAGLRALECFESGRREPAGWVEEQRAALAAMEKPNAEVVLAAVRPVRVLLDKLTH